MKPQQLPFDLGHRPAFEREDLWVSESNRDAVAWLDKYPGWPAPALILYGPPASGKTHLCHVFQNQTDAVCITPATINDFRGVNDFPQTSIIDDAEKMIGETESETALFHTWNRAKEEGAQLLLTGENPPARWNFTLPDLKSRLLAAPAVAIAPPDEQLMAVVLAKLFSDRQLAVPAEVISFITARIERSFKTVNDLVTEIDRQSLSQKRPVTVPLVREILQGQGMLL
ncbi:MAG TPA: DnaA/Hda family protein [Patescibacteria group bacterium]|nr:DnaA/Hda family protein [Patescibacteria group bacterium]